MSKAKTTAGQRLIASAKEEAAKWRKRSYQLASAVAICPMVDRSGRVTDVEWKRYIFDGSISESMGLMAVKYEVLL